MKYHTMVAIFSIIILGVWSVAFAADNAQYIRCRIPDTLTTDQVFDAQITMLNNGTTTWSWNETPVTLVSQDPKCNKTWGTWFIILGQGGSVPPGNTFTFRSRLKAPGTAGTHAFAWQIERWMGGGGGFDTTTPFFGDKVTGASIYVKQRTEQPPPLPPHKDSLLDASDLEYMGSFKVPNLAGHQDIYEESGIACKHGNLLVRTGNSQLYETTIPALVKVVADDYSTVNTGSVVRDWGALNYGTIGGENIGSNCGFWYDDDSQLVYWSHYHPYYTGSASGFPQLMATRLNTNGTQTNSGYWYVPGDKGPYKGWWGGPLKLSKRFADTYTDGRDMALGFGGYYSVCGFASRGPALGAIARPNTAANSIDLLPLMTYNGDSYSIRNGDYLPVVDGIWDLPLPEAPWKGAWAYDDYCRAGIFVDLPDKRGYLAFVNLVVGRVGYDYGGYNIDGHWENGWYFYDVDRLGQAARGTIRPDSIQPSSFVSYHYPAGGSVTGACFDSASRMIYVYMQFAQNDNKPLVHAFHIKEGPSASETNLIVHNDPEIQTNPNPFNPTVMISIGSCSAIPLQMVIYNVTGGLVVDLTSEIRVGKVSWDASGQPSGTYIIRVQFGKQILTKRITLLK